MKTNISEKDEEENYMMKSSMTTVDDWSQYSPAMLKAPMSAALRQPSQPFSQPLPYESSLPPNNSTPVKLMSPVVASSKVQYKSAGDTKNVQSRRRPVLTTSASQTLLEAKMASLNTESGNASKEHELEMEILQLKRKQEQLKLKQEEEKLKQEEMKTELLGIQIEKESGVQWVFSNDEGK